jgi:hypothetical protein
VITNKKQRTPDDVLQRELAEARSAFLNAADDYQRERLKRLYFGKITAFAFRAVQSEAHGERPDQ